MESETVFRNNAQRGLMVAYFSLMALLGLTLLTGGVRSVRSFGWVFLAFAALGIYRANRSAYLSIDGKLLTVRTLVRTRHIDLTDVQRVEPTYFTQMTLRVMPVVCFKDGGRYKLSEFLMQKRSYEKSLPKNRITKLVSLISDRLAEAE
jgi:hypothetical protein